MKTRDDFTYLSHKRAELAPLFLVSSHPNSRPTGIIEMDPTPIMTNSAYNAPVLCGLTAHMSESHASAIKGQIMRAERPRWCVSTLSKRGEVANAATRPDRMRAAPCHGRVSTCILKSA